MYQFYRLGLPHGRTPHIPGLAKHKVVLQSYGSGTLVSWAHCTQAQCCLYFSESVNLDIRPKTDTHKSFIQGNLGKQETLRGHTSKYRTSLITTARNASDTADHLSQSRIWSGLGVPSGESHNKSCYNSGFKGNRSGGFEHEGKLNRFLTVSHCLSQKTKQNKTQPPNKKTQTKPTTTTNLRKDKGTGILISLL